MSAARLRRPEASSTFLRKFELAFEAGEGVEGAGVSVAGLFEEVGAMFEGHAADRRAEA